MENLQDIINSDDIGISRLNIREEKIIMLTIAERAEKMAKFFGVEQPQDMNFKEWNDKLLDMEIEYEQLNGTKVPFYTYMCHIPCVVNDVNFEASKIYNMNEDWKYIDDNGKVAIIPPYYKEYFVYKK